MYREKTHPQSVFKPEKNHLRPPPPPPSSTPLPLMQKMTLFSGVQCFHVSTPPAVRPTILRQMDMGSLTCAQMWAVPYTRRRVRHKQVCTTQESTRRGRTTVRHPAPAKGSNPGCTDLNSDSLTTEPRPPSPPSKTQGPAQFGRQSRAYALLSGPRR